MLACTPPPLCVPIPLNRLSTLVLDALDAKLAHLVHLASTTHATMLQNLANAQHGNVRMFDAQGRKILTSFIPDEMRLSIKVLTRASQERNDRDGPMVGSTTDRVLTANTAGKNGTSLGAQVLESFAELFSSDDEATTMKGASSTSRRMSCSSDDIPLTQPLAHSRFSGSTPPPPLPRPALHTSPEWTVPPLHTRPSRPPSIDGQPFLEAGDEHSGRSSSGIKSIKPRSPQTDRNERHDRAGNVTSDTGTSEDEKAQRKRRRLEAARQFEQFDRDHPVGGLGGLYGFTIVRRGNLWEAAAAGGHDDTTAKRRIS